MTYKRGDVVLVPFPTTDGSRAKARPAVVVHSDGHPPAYDDNVLLMISSRVHRHGPTIVHVSQASPEGQAMGLLTDSVIIATKIASVHGPLISKRIGQVRSMAAIDAALKCALDLKP